jgi:hypothetical protein
MASAGSCEKPAGLSLARFFFEAKAGRCLPPRIPAFPARFAWAEQWRSSHELTAHLKRAWRGIGKRPAKHAGAMAASARGTVPASPGVVVVKVGKLRAVRLAPQLR